MFTENGGFDIRVSNSLKYDKNAFHDYYQENFMDLLSESPHTVRRHFRTVTAKATFDDTFISICEGEKKSLNITLCNKLYVPQYMTVRFLNVPDEWQVENGCEREVGLEHWHGSHVTHTNGFDFVFTPLSIKKGSYTIVVELSANGRGERYYFPITFINGAC